MAEALLFLLQKVRTGKVKGFSICIIGERVDGVEFTVGGSATEAADLYEVQLLGAMRLEEERVLRRRRERKEDQ